MPELQRRFWHGVRAQLFLLACLTAINRISSHDACQIFAAIHVEWIDSKSMRGELTKVQGIGLLETHSFA